MLDCQLENYNLFYLFNNKIVVLYFTKHELLF